MAEGGLNSLGSAPNVLTADATLPENPASAPKTDEGAATPTVPPGSAGGGMAPASAGDKEAVAEASGQKTIAKFAKLAGLGELKSDGSHKNNMANAAVVLKKLIELGEKNPAMKTASTDFLKELAIAGKSAAFNWGLKLNGVPLNKVVMSDKAFKGLDAQNSKGTTPLPAQQNSQPTADDTAQPQTPSEGSGTPQSTNTAGTQPAGNAMQPTPELLAAMKSALKEVAASGKDGDNESISRADIAESRNSTKLPAEFKAMLVEKIDKVLAQPGHKSTMSVEEAIEALISPGAGRPNASTPEAPTQKPTPQSTSAPANPNPSTQSGNDEPLW
jgi:hypothetical protein